MRCPVPKTPEYEELVESWAQANSQVLAASRARYLAMEAIHRYVEAEEIRRLRSLGIEIGDRVIVERSVTDNIVGRPKNGTVQYPRFEEAFLTGLICTTQQAFWELRKTKKDGTLSSSKFRGSAKNIFPYSEEALGELQ